jgi:hypothetical protein
MPPANHDFENDSRVAWMTAGLSSQFSAADRAPYTVARAADAAATPVGRPEKNFCAVTPPVKLTKGAINTGEYWLMVSRIIATSPTVRAVIDPVSCRLDAYSFSP